MGNNVQETTKTKRDSSRNAVKQVFILVSVLVVALTALAVFQEKDIERGILEVCATQQDGYVQLVIDQINLKDNRDDEEIITDILETLDSSAGKYWLFSQDQTMLFVKDVAETNRYKGLSAASYWGAEGAPAFLAELVPGEVRHDFVEVDGVEYLASGAVFTYDGRDYRLCLLTNRSALLDNNEYLGARSRLMVVLLLSLGMLFIVPMGLAFFIAHERRQADHRQDVIAMLNVRLGEASERIVRDEVYDNRRHVWSGDLLEAFAYKLMERGEDDAFFVQVLCDDAEEAERLLDRATVALGSSAVRFRVADDIVVFLFTSGDPAKTAEQVTLLLSEKSKITQIVPLMKEE